MAPEARHPDDAQQLALLIENVSDYAIFMLDRGGHIRTWNRGAERAKGYTADEIIGRHLSVFYTPEDNARNHVEHELKVALRDGRYAEEGWRVRKDGSRFWASVTITAVRDHDGTHIGFGKVTRDLTDRRMAEDRLDQFRRLVASVQDYAIFMLDPEGLVATWNPGAEHLKGYTADEIIGRHFEVFYTEPDRERRHPAFELATADGEGSYAEEGWRVRKDGTTFWASVTITAVRSDDGELIGYAKVTRDLTTRREAEEQLRAANAELDRFASIAAHDLNDPLRTIAGFAELLEREELSDSARQYLTFISSTADRMQRLLDSLLAYARAGESTLPPEPVPLRVAADRVLSSLTVGISDRSAEVVARLPDEAVVLAAPADVELILQNLVANALKFGDPDQPRIEIVGERHAAGWRVSVSDNGVGIAPEDRERIFAPFERAHPEIGAGGSGLGLAICERLARRAGGEIGVDSTLGQGSRFWVLLPSPVATS